MEKYPPPPHLTDLAITQITESHGRERRFRYFSLPNYRIVAEREKIDPSSYSEIDLSQVRDFMPVDENQFYEEENALNAYIDRYHGDQPAEGKTPKKRPNKNPVLPDGTVKKGRPRKQVTIEEPAKGKSAKKRKRGVELPPEAEGAEDGEQGVMAPPTKRRKGQDAAVPPIDEATVDATDVEPATPEVPQKKKRGRPPKKVPEATPQVEQTTPTVTKRRGRPRKATLPPELLQHVDVPSSPSMVPSGPSATRVSNQFVTASPPDAVPSTSQHDIVNQEQPSGELPPGATFDTSIAPALNTSSEIPIDPLLAAEEPPDRRTVSSVSFLFIFLWESHSPDYSLSLLLLFQLQEGKNVLYLMWSPLDLPLNEQSQVFSPRARAQRQISHNPVVKRRFSELFLTTTVS